ncbi:TetR/AcrR family transcriptional regulator [Actinosynnema sp. NPDC047251]|uniref:Transcriptional regulator n=1 Tax=Saccharothrix espanaensis (strain ATCC 51144 / DSM 44229 / JCM 9112 / NBRC 15066 / NRRL 15764) TaxID=1179773 RepID=K0K506_SACES|nr:TetR/AcrR family transcriptional regulator [Saccharothrix espanaensis]CCH32662.1 Transcriptional regulator [Saccharothrix espanaensis DSM 44229]
MAARRTSRGVQRDGSVEVAIIDAVGRLLADRSIEDTAVSDILDEAGVSRATFYFYFQSKHAVVAALFERILDDVYGEFERNWLEVDAVAGDAVDSLYTALRAVYRVFLAHGPVLRTVARAYPEQPELAGSFEHMMDRLIAGATAKIVADRATGVAPAGHDAGELATTLVWMNERCFYVNSLQPDRGWASSDAMIRSLADIWASAIYRPA